MQCCSPEPPLSPQETAQPHISTMCLWTLPLSARDSVVLKYCSSTVQAVSLILLDTPQNPTQLTLMAVNRNHTRKHEEKAKPQLQTCFRDSMGPQEQNLTKTHRVAKGAGEWGHTFSSAAHFPLAPSITALALLPLRHSQLSAPLQSLCWPLCTAEGLNSSDFSSPKDNPPPGSLPNKPASPPSTHLSPCAQKPLWQRSPTPAHSKAKQPGLEAFEMPSDPPSPKRI